MASPDPIFEYYRPFSTKLSAAINQNDFSFVVDDSSGFVVGCTIFIDSEQMKVTAINTSTNTLTVESYGITYNEGTSTHVGVYATGTGTSWDYTVIGGTFTFNDPNVDGGGIVSSVVNSGQLRLNATKLITSSQAYSISNTIRQQQNGTTAAIHADEALVSVGWIKAVTHSDNSAVILCDITKTLNNPASAELILSKRSKDASSTDLTKSTGALSDRTGERASLFEEFQDCRIIDNETGLVLFRGRIYHIRNQYDFQYGSTVKVVLKDMLQELVDIPIDNAPPALRAISLTSNSTRSGVVSTVVNGLSANFDTTEATKFEASETTFTTEELEIGSFDDSDPPNSIWDIATGQQQALVLVNDFAKQDPHSGGEDFGYDYYVDANRSSSALNVADPKVSLNYFKRGSRPAAAIETHGFTLEYPSVGWGGQTRFRKAMLTDSEFTNPNGTFFTSMVAHFEDTGEEDTTKRSIHGIESFELLRGNIPANLENNSANDFPWEGKRIQYIEDADVVADDTSRRHDTTGQSLQTTNPSLLFDSDQAVP